MFAVELCLVSRNRPMSPFVKGPGNFDVLLVPDQSFVF